MQIVVSKPQGRWIAWCLVIMAVTHSVGCGGGGNGSKRKTVSVSGTVRLNGQPLADADVHFMGGEHVGFGKTNSNGEYRLVQGAAPGPNKVFISKVDPASAAAAASDPTASLEDPEQMRAAMEGGAVPGSRKAPAGPKNLIPEDYSNPQKTKLTFEVPETAVTGADFDL